MTEGEGICPAGDTTVLITLRQYYKAAALAALANAEPEAACLADLAKWAAAIADAMLAEDQEHAKREGDVDGVDQDTGTRNPS